jgi:hypothetical protein
MVPQTHPFELPIPSRLTADRANRHTLVQDSKAREVVGDNPDLTNVLTASYAESLSAFCKIFSYEFFFNEPSSH